MNFERDGAALFGGAALPVLSKLRATLASLPAGEAGIRIHGIEPLRPLLSAGGAIGAAAASRMGEQCRPVRAILFDKTAHRNWSLAWHQDRTISVVERRDVAGFGPWTVKQGMVHVAPPFDLLATMVTLRVHLDDVPEENAPLMIAPGSHRFGRIDEDRIEEIVRRCGTHTCLAAAGDIWLYATPILHASAASARPAHRRVLQIDYADQSLPSGLDWLGV